MRVEHLIERRASEYIVSSTPEKVPRGGRAMKVWQKPQIEETETGLEVTSYMPADLGRR